MFVTFFLQRSIDIATAEATNKMSLLFLYIKDGICLTFFIFLDIDLPTLLVMVTNGLCMPPKVTVGKKRRNKRRRLKIFLLIVSPSFLGVLGFSALWKTLRERNPGNGRPMVLLTIY